MKYQSLVPDIPQTNSAQCLMTGSAKGEYKQLTAAVVEVNHVTMIAMSPGHTMHTNSIGHQRPTLQVQFQDLRYDGANMVE